MATNNSVNTYLTPTSGQVLAPGQCLFASSLSATASNVTGDGTYYIIIFDTVSINQNSNYNNGTGTFTAPITGNYFFSANVEFFDLTAAGGWQLFLSVNAGGGPNIGGGVQSAALLPGFASNTLSVSIDSVLHLNAGNTINVMLYVGLTPSSKQVDVFGDAEPQTTFAGFLI
jgi:hypothetical protein